ncbi:YARHG domain-containing protein [Suicoccus acidiformans]|uniref:YARHG domain-containing protein n=1 Tax=Suicoccus acidiformans TaxID=2036206 RepID=UPI003B83490C
MEEIHLGKYEIYARYGYIFTSEELQAHFQGQNWCKECFNGETFPPTAVKRG